MNEFHTYKWKQKQNFLYMCRFDLAQHTEHNLDLGAASTACLTPKQ